MNTVLASVAAAIAWCVLFMGTVLVLAYQCARLSVATLVLVVLLIAYWILGAAPDAWKILLSIPLGLIVLLNVRPLRVAFLTRPFLKKYRRLLPSMSATEREALDAGTVWWDGELFTGGPNWQKLMSAKVPALTPTEQAFINGPCEHLCALLDDWDITHRRADSSPEVWAYIKAQGFFAMIIPKRYGGLEFSVGFAISKYSAPSDRLGRSIVDLITRPTAARERLSHHVYKTLGPSNMLGLPHRIEQARALSIIDDAEAALLRDYDSKVLALVNVDDFAAHELVMGA